MSLRDRRAWADESRLYEVEIPETSPPIYLQLRRVDPDLVGAAVDRAAKEKDPTAALTRSAASLLARYCAGVCEMGGAGELRSIDPDDPDGTPLVFGDRLADLLEMPDEPKSGRSPTNVVIELCSKAGVGKLFVGLCEWSGMDTDERIKELRGE